MAKLGIGADMTEDDDTSNRDDQASLPPLPSDPFPFRTTSPTTGSSPTAASGGQADSTSPDGEDGAGANVSDTGPSCEGDSDNSCEFVPHSPK